MRVEIKGKQVWPPKGGQGWHRYRFYEERDGSLVYAEQAVDGKGEPLGKPEVVVTMEKEEAERLRIILCTGSEEQLTPRERRIRQELLESILKLERLDESKKTSDEQAK